MAKTTKKKTSPAKPRKKATVSIDEPSKVIEPAPGSFNDRRRKARGKAKEKSAPVKAGNEKRKFHRTVVEETPTHIHTRKFFKDAQGKEWQQVFTVTK